MPKQNQGGIMIQINDHWRIEIDGRNITLQRRQIVKDKNSENLGKEY